MSHKPWHQPKPSSTPQQSLLSCARKYRHHTIESASTERDRLTLNNPAPTGFHYEVYYCAFCRNYHVGKAPDGGYSA